MTQKWTYNFGSYLTEGNSKMKDLLGSKGANLAEMSLIGITIPPGFTVTSELCSFYYNNYKTLPEDLYPQLRQALSITEKQLDLQFGGSDPLLLSVRSGSSISMPGMMDTILNLGLNDQTVESLGKKTNDMVFAYDCYRRFIQIYAEIVLSISKHDFESLLLAKKREYNLKNSESFDEEALRELVLEYKEKVFFETGRHFPQDPWEQLINAVTAVLNSWMSPRAITYRKLNNISEKLGTGVTIQSMVFGNMDENSGTGVVFTRNPNNGLKHLYGEYLLNSQGEDLVSGIATPQSLNNFMPSNAECHYPSMEEKMPRLYQELEEICRKLEEHYREMQDIEFTIEKGRLWVLQTRSGKRTINSGLKIVVDLVEENIITIGEALLRINPYLVDQLLHPTIDEATNYEVLTVALPASPGAASGKIVFSVAEVEAMSARSEKTILVRNETSPEDINGIFLANGILTCRGGMTSHAAVVARGMGKTCITGASEVFIDEKNEVLKIKNIILNKGDIITINGSNGEVILGEVPTIQPELPTDLLKILTWADDIAKLRVRCNAETVKDVETGLKFGAEGIGLCRTEHMFFDTERILLMRSMIVSENLEKRKFFLDKLLELQKRDFLELFRLMAGLPINIRLLDPPLHEFLPHNVLEAENLANYLGRDVEEIISRSSQLKETNPMLGHRGCRLAISSPEIYEMQIIAISEAMAELQQENITPNVEIMVPLIFSAKELEHINDLIEKSFEVTEEKYRVKLSYKKGTMIELPRAALIAGKIAPHADFFSFGTNDLTQTTLGISRDDSASFLNYYKNHHILEFDPFINIDIEGVGQLIKIAIDQAKISKAELKFGVCGEHGGDPYSIEFFHEIGLDYVSCSPYRIIIAKLAAARAALKDSIFS